MQEQLVVFLSVAFLLVTVVSLVYEWHLFGVLFMHIPYPFSFKKMKVTVVVFRSLVVSGSIFAVSQPNYRSVFGDIFSNSSKRIDFVILTLIFVCLG